MMSGDLDNMYVALYVCVVPTKLIQNFLYF